MATAEEILKTRVISVLRSPACLDIQFTIVGSTIMGYGYGYVADMIKQDGIRIKIGNTGAFTASYDHHGLTPTCSAILRLRPRRKAEPRSCMRRLTP
jgi:hypothetical protein